MAVAGRVAIFVPSLAGGGAERAMVNLALGMAELRRQVDLVVGSDEGPFRDLIRARVELVPLGCRRMLTALPPLARYLRARRPACLYAVMDHANVVALWARALARPPVKVVVSLRNTLSAELGSAPSLRGRAIVKLARRLYPSAHGIIAVSQGVAEDAACVLRLDPRKITVIANPVITPELAALMAEPVAEPWLADGAPPVILGCGRLVPQKDFATLIDAFARVRARRPGRLVILGEGPERSALLERATAAGIAADVALPGFVLNPFKYMARAAAFVLSSRYEGSPNALVQALACGCPAVATDCPSGPREIVAGVPAAELVPVGDAAAMATAIERRLVGGRAGPAAACLARFGHRHAAARYLEVGQC